MNNLEKIISRLKSLKTENEFIIPEKWNVFNIKSHPANRREGEVLVNEKDFYIVALENIQESKDEKMTQSIREDVLYSVLPRAFSAWDHYEEGDVCGGTLLKCIALLPILKRMNITAIYLLPVFEPGQEAKKGELPSPYAIKDIMKIDPALHCDMLGDGITPEEEFGAFIEAAHKMGIKVLLDFVFRTCASDNVLINEHPDWFYWIRSDCAEKLRSPGIPDGKFRIVGHNNIKELYSSPDMARFLDYFEQPPKNDEWKSVLKEYQKGERLLSEITAEKLNKVVMTGFADTINDPQPPWTDVTYYKYYFDVSDEVKAIIDTEKYPPFIAQDGVKCSIFPANTPNYELWDYIADVIPFYIREYDLDGARIDMAHALPEELGKRIIEKIRFEKKNFILWSEEFSPANAQKAKKQGYDFILGDSFNYLGRIDKKLVKNAENAALPITAALETPDTPRIFYTLEKNEKRVKNALKKAFLLPNSVPFINCGQELCELQPMNLGLLNDEKGRYVLPKNHPMYGRLAFFDRFMLNWLYKGDMPEYIRGLAAEKKKIISQRNETEMTEKKTAYFCMEYGLDPKFKIYSGGLGILAGDILKAAKDLKKPMVAMGILWRQGYGEQIIDKDGKPADLFREYSYDFLKDTGITVKVKIRGENVRLKVWLCDCFGNVPLYLLDANLPDNPDSLMTGQLYGWFGEERIAQEIILGIGGVKALRKLGLEPDIYHFNDSHPMFAGFELIRERMKKGEDFESAYKNVRKSIVFTTHTPVPSGNEIHSLKLLKYMGAFNGLTKEQVKFIGGDPFSMTAAGLRLSYISNGVAELHAKTAEKMWKDVPDKAPIIAVTNGVHNGTWQDKEIYKAYLDDSDILEPHNKAKAALFKEIKKRNKVTFDPDVLTIGFARRAAPYKRGTLIFSNMEKLEPLLNSEKIQIIFSGKAHPNDLQGKKIVAKMFELSEKYPKNVVFLQNYDMTIGKLLTRGCDVWLNNPRRPMEASGTSGMKAAMNGVLNFSVLDGWWPEGCIHGVNGWQIGGGYEGEDADRVDSESLYETLFGEVVPTFYNDKTKWAKMMRESIKMSTYNFSAERMVREYYEKMYALQPEIKED